MDSAKGKAETMNVKPGNQSPKPHDLFSQSLQEHLRVVKQLESSLPLLQSMADAIVASLRKGGTIYWCGNGGSAADSQHMAAELVGRFRRERRALASVSLTTDTSILTALGNDYGFETVFSRQVESLCKPADVLIGISTSGNSENVCRAVTKAREIGAHTLVMTGASGGKLAPLAHACFAAPSSETARIQECHSLAAHMICDFVEHAMHAGEQAK